MRVGRYQNLAFAEEYTKNFSIGKKRFFHICWHHVGCNNTKFSYISVQGEKSLPPGSKLCRNFRQVNFFPAGQHLHYNNNNYNHFPILLESDSCVVVGALFKQCPEVYCSVERSPRLAQECPKCQNKVEYHFISNEFI